MVWTGQPARRRVSRQGVLDEPGDGRGPGAARVPLQGEGHIVGRVDRADHGTGVPAGERAGQHDPVEFRLVLPADGGEVGHGQLRLRRVDAGRGQGLPLRQGPGGEQGLRGGSQPVAGQVGEPYPFLPGEPVTWPQAHQQRLGAEHLASQAVTFADEPAGDPDVDARVGDRLDEVG